MAYQFRRLKKFADDLGLTLTGENVELSIFAISDEKNGIINCIFDCSGDQLVIEQVIALIPKSNPEPLYKRLLQINRSLHQGAFVIDEQAARVFFRSTHRYQSLTPADIEGSLRSLEQALTDHGQEMAMLCDENE